MKETPPTVTNHAVLRWLERVERIDIAALRAQMAAYAAIGVSHGAGSVIIGAGKLVIRNGVVVTTLPRHSMRKDLLGTLEAHLSGDIVARRKMRGRRR